MHACVCICMVHTVFLASMYSVDLCSIIQRNSAHVYTQGMTVHSTSAVENACKQVHQTLEVCQYGRHVDCYVE